MAEIFEIKPSVGNFWLSVRTIHFGYRPVRQEHIFQTMEEAIIGAKLEARKEDVEKVDIWIGVKVMEVEGP